MIKNRSPQNKPQKDVQPMDQLMGVEWARQRMSWIGIMLHSRRKGENNEALKPRDNQKGFWPLFVVNHSPSIPQ
ncbi:hypothetical protein CEXT_235351 [Caerostris extrusa]|uniref:Uncharacterized protein n=1 Tax=Caerostris extrusa TaxID=172846 RepID=A0AAV4X681_CAEEX|nr:hypothetical protein CEXT_235351 [Caerostris extrusa]